LRKERERERRGKRIQIPDEEDEEVDDCSVEGIWM